VASGLTDVDAITLSSLRMFGMDKLTAVQTITAITLATLSNLAFKTGLVVVIGGAALARRVLPGLVAIAAGTGRRPITDLIGNTFMPIRKLVVAKGIYYVEIPAAGLTLLCGTPGRQRQAPVPPRHHPDHRTQRCELRDRAQRHPALGFDDPERAPVQPGRVSHPADALPPGHAAAQPPQQLPAASRA
jgi:hypothetical protein